MSTRGDAVLAGGELLHSKARARLLASGADPCAMAHLGRALDWLSDDGFDSDDDEEEDCLETKRSVIFLSFPCVSSYIQPLFAPILA